VTVLVGQAKSGAKQLVITTTMLTAGVLGQQYSALLQASGGTSPYTWAITAGSLPSGLKLDLATGLISGVPSTPATATFTVMVSDSGSPAQSVSGNFTIVVPPSALQVIMTSLPAATVNQAYSATLQASGGTPPYAWTVSSGTLPPGLILSPSGSISGMPMRLPPELTQTVKTLLTVR
jgi:hypothetical protein